jgi:3-oxoacyl-[acyl-carrier protein] reductase
MRKTIVVVGASKGIGAELVTLFAANSNLQVIALARSIEEENAWRDKDNVFVYNFDLASLSITEDLNRIFSKHSRIDFLINNAGVLVNKPFLELSKNDIHTSYQVNVMGVMESLQFFLPKMLGKGGHVVNISSMGAFQGSVKFAGLSTYSSSKAALTNLTEMLAEEFKDSNVKFNCLCLGAVQTEMLAKAFPGYEAPISASKMANYIADFTLNQWQWMNGKIIPVSLSTP